MAHSLAKGWNKKWQRNWQRTLRGWWWRYFWRRGQRSAQHYKPLRYGRIALKPIHHLKNKDWHKVSQHFRDPEISHLNGTPPNLMPVWLIKKILKNDSNRTDRATFGIFEGALYIGTIELYDMTALTATLGIIIGERSHWGKGYGIEAIHALLHYAFEEKGLELIRLNTFGDNIRAQRAFKKVGFVERSRHKTRQGRDDIVMELYASAYRRLLEQPPVWHSHHH